MNEIIGYILTSNENNDVIIFYYTKIKQPQKYSFEIIQGILLYD